jgi:uncharacterized protein YcsI (UPF0317 family)
MIHRVTVEYPNCERPISFEVSDASCVPRVGDEIAWGCGATPAAVVTVTRRRFYFEYQLWRLYAA